MLCAELFVRFKEVHHVYVAMEVVSDTRQLRCEKLQLPENGLLNRRLDLSFQLPYVHDLKVCDVDE